MLQRGKFDQVFVTRTSEITKHYLVDVITRMVNHRQWILDNYSKHRTADQFKAITTIRTKLACIKGKDMRTHCIGVLAVENELNLLLPHEGSRYHPHTNNQIADIILYANKYLQEK